jgi:hypothetical protein
MGIYNITNLEKIILEKLDNNLEWELISFMGMFFLFFFFFSLDDHRELVVTIVLDNVF